MLKRITVAVFVLFCVEGEVGVSCYRFGHEPGAYSEPNLIPFESSEMTYVPNGVKTPNKWYSNVATEIVNDTEICFSGSTCLRTVNRQEPWRAVFYRVTYDLLETGCTYLFNVFMKLENSTHDLIKTDVKYRLWHRNSSLSNTPVYKNRFRRYNKIENIWLFYSVMLTVTEQDKNDFEFIDFYFRVDDYTDYMLDAASLTKVSYPDWKIEANNYIADYRMGNISLSLNVSSGLDPYKVTIQVNQTRRDFPFGLSLTAETIAGNDSDPYVQRYRDWVEKRATWAVFRNAAKWKTMERLGRDDTDRKFEIPDRAYAWLHSKNISMRGHTIHWNARRYTPDWVAQQPNKTAEIDRRTNYVVEHFKGKFKHWDVLNEYSNTRLYQNWLGREDILEYLHSDVRRIDPDVKLFTNEWGNLQTRYHFADTVNAVLRLKKHQLVDCIGLQGHFTAIGDELNMELIKRRLEVITSLGVPVWITALTMTHDDPVIRGKLLADCLTLFYGTPGVEGIILWHFAPSADSDKLNWALATPNITNTAAGDKFDEMLASWSTNVQLTLSSSQTSTFNIRAFYGTYNITLFYDGVEKAKLTDVHLKPEEGVLKLNSEVSLFTSLTTA